MFRILFIALLVGTFFMDNIDKMNNLLIAACIASSLINNSVLEDHRKKLREILERIRHLDKYR